MARKSIKVIPKIKGRLATDKDLMIALRVPKATVKALDTWAEGKGLTRSEAIRGMIERELGLVPSGLEKIFGN